MVHVVASSEASEWKTLACKSAQAAVTRVRWISESYVSSKSCTRSFFNTFIGKSLLPMKLATSSFGTFQSVLMPAQRRWTFTSTFSGKEQVLRRSLVMLCMNIICAAIRDFSFSPDAALIASVGLDGVGRIWPITGASTTAVGTISGHEGWILGIAWDPMNRVRALVWPQLFIRHAAGPTHRADHASALALLLRLLLLIAWPCAVEHDSLLATMQYFATFGSDQTLIIWQSEDLTEVCRLTSPFGKRRAGDTARLAWSLDGQMLFVSRGYSVRKQSHHIMCHPCQCTQGLEVIAAVACRIHVMALHNRLLS